MKAGEIRTIHFVEFNARINTLGSLALAFPKYGSLLLATLLRDRGYTVRYFLEGVSPMDFDRIAEADALCLPVFAPALTKVRDFAERVMRTKPGLPVILGGPQVCFFPETVLDRCTFAVRSEGDEVLPRLIECLNAGGRPDDIPGLSFLRDGRAVHVPEAPPPAIPPTSPDVSLIEGFDGDRKKLFGIAPVIRTLQTSRGCRFRCKFCPTERLFQGVYRSRDIDSVIAEIRRLPAQRRRFFVVDNDFCSDKRNTRLLLQRIIDEKLGVHLTIFERHEIGRDPEMLDLLRRAGVRVIIVGVESLRDASLSAFNKRQTQAEVLASITAIRAHGMHVLSTFVLGYDEDTRASADEMVSFVKENRLLLNLFILHDAERDEGAKLLIPLNRRFMTYYAAADPERLDYWDYMTGSFVSYFPKRMKPTTLQRMIFDINDRAFSHPGILREVFSPDLHRAFFGVFFGYGMKRINRNLRRFARRGYMDYLRRIEEGLYDGNEELIDEKLAALRTLPFPPPVTGYAQKPFYRVPMGLALMPSLARLAVIRWRLRRRAAVPAAG